MQSFRNKLIAVGNNSIWNSLYSTHKYGIVITWRLGSSARPIILSLSSPYSWAKQTTPRKSWGFLTTHIRAPGMRRWPWFSPGQQAKLQSPTRSWAQWRGSNAKHLSGRLSRKRLVPFMSSTHCTESAIRLRRFLRLPIDLPRSPQNKMNTVCAEYGQSSNRHVADNDDRAPARCRHSAYSQRAVTLAGFIVA